MNMEALTRTLATEIALHQPEAFVATLEGALAEAWDEGHEMPSLHGVNPYRKD